MSHIICLSYYEKAPDGVEVIDVTSRVKSVFSPFFLHVPGLGLMENVWQYSKVYKCHLDSDNNVTDEWYKWRREGINKNIAVRYPMGKDARPKFSFWDGERLSYIDARKKIYIPLYTASVKYNCEDAFLALKDLYTTLSEEGRDLYLRDFDGYNRHKLNMFLDDVINCETRTMGHCFVIEKMLLEQI